MSGSPTHAPCGAADVVVHAWPAARLGEAMQGLAARAGLLEDTASRTDLPEREPESLAELELAVRRLARRLGIEAEAVCARQHEVLPLVRSGGPALALVPGRPLRVLAIAGRSGRHVTLLRPDGAVHRVRTEPLAEELRLRAAGHQPEVEQLLAIAGVPASARGRALTLLEEDSAHATFAAQRAWILRPSAGTSLHAQCRRAGVVRRVALLAGAHALEVGLLIAAWAILGRAALGQGAEHGMLVAWALLLLALPLLRVWVEREAAYLSIAGGAWLKRRLLTGAMQLDPDAVRHQGAGQLLGKVGESEALETLGLGGGLMAGMAAVELVLAAVVLALGAGGLLSVGVLVATIAVTALLALRYWRERAAWTDRRLAMTGELVEQMVGRRTRLVQLARARWHEGEDETLADYAAASRRMDLTAAALLAAAPRALLAGGVAALMPAFIAGAAPAALAIGLGGTLLAYEALSRLTLALAQLTGGLVAWREVGPLIRSAARESGPPPAAIAPDVGAGDARLLVADGVRYRHANREEPVLRGGCLTIDRGDRVVLSGASGAGKSTLVAILGGLRRPHAGLLLVGGLDPHTLDADAWRRHVVVVPQFHENHVFSGTLAFNLLLGRRWPPEPEDVELAEAVCRELALGPLLERMPAGMQQTVGESGWQLSHGERSRLFIARALLQESELVVLDESFSALDPETAAQVMACVTSRARAVVVIAHR